jgi:MFS family permease
MMMVAAAWQMYELTNSAWDLGLVGLFQFLPVLLFTLPAGHVADRYHRGRVVAGTQLLQWRWPPPAAAGRPATATFCRANCCSRFRLLGTARTFQAPAQQSLVPSLVPIRHAGAGHGLSSAGNQVSVIGGPAAAGLLFMGTGTAVYAVRRCCWRWPVRCCRCVRDVRSAASRRACARCWPARASSGRASRCWARCRWT